MRKARVAFSTLGMAVVLVAGYTGWWMYSPVHVIEARSFANLSIGMSKSELLSVSDGEIIYLSPQPKPEGLKNWWLIRDLSEDARSAFIDADEWRIDKMAQEYCPSYKPCSSTSAYFDDDILVRFEIACFECK